MNALLKILTAVFALALCLWPSWLFLIARSLAGPEGFWQNLAFSATGWYFLGGMQLVFLVVWIFIAFFISVCDIDSFRAGGVK